jgi:hypothetical protein
MDMLDVNVGSFPATPFAGLYCFMKGFMQIYLHEDCKSTYPILSIAA